ncbi:hypothetical protein L615_004600000140 [Nocardioides sp. J9]|uniref:DUF6318 family protein n=1 Tax=Nocardioides sp. J9 TaxID=935844 RepID=UPI0011A9EA67|nr:DUF6318 family protein [Nocardioides sp. J9]TWG95919.1 hypothetical protein L615_004600000140 [Nocardioides sp. J9]
MRPLRTLAATALALAALSGCSDESTSPTETSSTPTESRSPTASPTPETPEEPALPDAATKATKAGARAFISYYWDLINYAQVTGDVKALKRVSGPNCAGCQSGIKGIREHYRSGGKVLGGEHKIDLEKLNRLSTSSGDALGFHGIVSATHSGQTIVAPDGSEDVRDAGTDRFDLYLLWRDSAGWRLDVMEVL